MNDLYDNKIEVGSIVVLEYYGYIIKGQVVSFINYESVEVKLIFPKRHYNLKNKYGKDLILIVGDTDPLIVI